MEGRPTSFAVVCWLGHGRLLHLRLERTHVGRVKDRVLFVVGVVGSTRAAGTPQQVLKATYRTAFGLYACKFFVFMCHSEIATRFDLRTLASWFRRAPIWREEYICYLHARGQDHSPYLTLPTTSSPRILANKLDLPLAAPNALYELSSVRGSEALFQQRGPNKASPTRQTATHPPHHCSPQH